MSTLNLNNPVLQVSITPYTLTLLALHPSSISGSSSNLDLQSIINGNEDGFFSVTKAPGELSILAEEGTARVILDKQLKLLDEPTHWKALKIVGPLDLSMVGVLNQFTEPLKQAKIAIFVSSTYLTDYILVKVEHLEQAVAVLKEAGWRFEK